MKGAVQSAPEVLQLRSKARRPRNSGVAELRPPRLRGALLREGADPEALSGQAERHFKVKFKN